MIPEAAEVRLSPEDRAGLEARLRASTTEQRDVLRARIILLAADGRSTRSIARTVGAPFDLAEVEPYSGTISKILQISVIEGSSQLHCCRP
jgi:hypothetical protein